MRRLHLFNDNDDYNVLGAPIKRIICSTHKIRKRAKIVLVALGNYQLYSKL